AIVVGGATAAPRLLDRLEQPPFRAGARIERRFGKVRGRGGVGRRRDVAVDRAAVGVSAGIADVEGFLNRRKRDFGGIFDLLGIVRHGQLSPLILLRVRRPCERPPQSPKPVSCPKRNTSVPVGGLSATSANILLVERCE